MNFVRVAKGQRRLRSSTIRAIRLFKTSCRNTTNAKTAAIRHLKADRTVVVSKVDKGTVTVLMPEGIYRAS